MEGSRQKSSIIRTFILDTVSSHPTDIVKTVAQKFAISRQAAARHIKILVTQGDLETEGNTSGRIYHPSKGRIVEWAYVIASQPEEESVWKEDILPLLKSLPDNVLELWHYCFAKIFNNGVDHSGGTTIRVQIIQQRTRTTINISDNGIGLFQNIKSKLHLDDHQHAALELSKVNLSAKPDNPGLNIFLASKMADHFTIISGKVAFAHQYGIAWDWALNMSDEEVPGTLISIIIENNTPRTASRILKEYGSLKTGNNAPPKICRPVRLVQYSAEALFSRTQARRVLAHIDRFEIAVLDFLSVDTIGPAFADQIFSVFSSEHPEIRLLYCNANKQVEAVIQAAKNSSTGTSSSFKA
jgi:hypothetical protein